jgi:hypothetical protein
MYNTKIVCTYNSPEIFTEYENKSLNDDEKYFVRNVIYRQELLDIFGIEEYNETNLSNAIHNLYETIKKQYFLKKCITKIAGTYLSIDEKMGFTMMFSYDYMYLTHLCISEFLEIGKISMKNIFELRSLLF